jgi:protein toll
VSAATSLGTLDLGENRISNLSGGAATTPQLPHLYGLSLAGNQLTSLGPAFFGGLEQLEVLNLAANQIGHIEQDTFAKLIKLKALRLDQNQVRRL